MSAETATLAVRKVVRVNLPPERAFELYTAKIASWWPTRTHSINEDAVVDVVLEGREGGRMFERTAAGEEADWGRVRAWEPPSRLVLDWFVNPKNPPTEIEVRFTQEGDATRVELEHRGWEAYGARARDSYEAYNGGWDTVLGKFEGAAAA